MNRNSTYRKLALRLLGVFAIVVGTSLSASSQNILSLANGGGGLQGGGSGVSGTGPYGPDTYLNDVICPYNDAACQDFGFVASGGWIKLFKVSPVPTPPGPIPFDFNKIVFYKDLRPMTTSEIQIWNSTSNSYQTIYNYNNWVNNEVDSVIFAQTYNTDTLMINAIFGPQLNPTFREIQVFHLPACAGTPVVSVQPATNQNPCFGSIVHLNANTNPTSIGHAYQWQRNVGGTGWVSIPGANSPGFSFQAIYTAEYRVVDTCLNGGAFAVSAPITVTVTPPPYATIPYFQGFENWTTGCATAPNSNDIPGLGWVNNPLSGNNSWRRHDEGPTGSWNSASNGLYSPASWEGTKSARFHSSMASLFLPGNLDLFVNAASVPGNKQVYFRHINMAIPGDSLFLLMSIDSGISWTRLGAWDSAGSTAVGDPKWRRRSVPLNTNANPVILRFSAARYGTDGTDIGIDSLYIAAPCTGTPVAGNISITSPSAPCAGSVFTLSPQGTTLAGNLIYTWEQSSDGTSFTAIPANVGNGSNNLDYVTPPLYDTVHYRLKVQCGTTGTPVYTNTIVFNVKSPMYASIPFMESFETWTTNCSVKDVPVDANNNIYWVNTPSTGSNSWRRNDEGGGIPPIWQYNTTSGPWYPAQQEAIHGNKAARFHSTGTFNGMVGSLDLLIDASTHIGPKEVNFHLINANGGDSLRVLWSDNGGGSFTKAATYGATGGWNSYSVMVPSDAPNTVIRFQGVGEFSASGSDIGLDSVRVIPPCAGSPVAGTISSAAPCPGVNFSIELQGTTIAAGLTYQWQSSPNGVSGWTNITGATTPYYSTNILANTYYRVIVTCTNSGQADTTPVQLIPVANFWVCYCGSGAPVTTGADIGNFTVQNFPGLSTHYSNGTATPQNSNPASNNTYSDFRNPQNPIVMYHDSSYRLLVRQINSGNFAAATVGVWLDTNQNGIFEVFERMLLEYTDATTTPPQQVLDTITIPNTTKLGITGLRIVLEQGFNSNLVPCGILTNPGETEDYLVEIKYPPCDGPTNPGTAVVSDSLSCVGYTVMAFDTTHEKYRSGLTWNWEYSPDGNSWAQVLGSQNKDTIEHIITGPVYFRMRMICTRSNIFFDTTYSNVVSVAINDPWACYCFSQSDGGINDTSDVGSFVLHGKLYVDTLNPGPHLHNPAAFRRRTDNTGLPVTELKTDSTYFYTILHTQPNGFHGDAKVTLFMDFNNDYQYSAAERIYSGTTSQSNFTLTGSITIPHNAITGVKTGMRLIINNDTGPNIPSDLACGTYTSGETEDYVIMLLGPMDVPHLGNITGMSLYPNPTDGRFNIVFTSFKPVSDAVISVTSITGQKVLEEQFKNTGTEFTTQLNLTEVPRGVYFVELKADNERLVRKVVIQ